MKTLLHKIRLWILKKLNGRPFEQEPVIHRFRVEKPITPVPVYGAVTLDPQQMNGFPADELERRVKQDLYAAMEPEMARFMTVRQSADARTGRMEFEGSFKVVPAGDTHGQN